MNYATSALMHQTFSNVHNIADIKIEGFQLPRTPKPLTLYRPQPETTA